MLVAPARGTQLVVPFPNANRTRSVAKRRRPAPRRRRTRKRNGRSIKSCCNQRSAAVPQRLRGAGCQPWCVGVCAIQNFYRARTTAPGLERTSTRDGGLRARRIAASSASPGARQQGVARSSLQISPQLRMHRHPQAYVLCRLAYFAHHAQKSMQHLAGLCSYYRPYCILCILCTSLYIYRERRRRTRTPLAGGSACWVTTAHRKS